MVSIDSPLWIYVNELHWIFYESSWHNVRFQTSRHVMKITSALHTYTRICPHTYACSRTWREYALIKNTHNDCVPFWGAICCITQLLYKEHILQLSCRHPDDEVGGVPGSDALPEDLHASSANRLQHELILIRRSCLIGRAALRDSHLNDCVKHSLIWKLLTGHIFLPRRRHFSVYLVWRVCSVRRERCYQTMPWLLHALLCRRWNLARFLNNGVSRREECPGISGLFGWGLA